MFWIDDWVGTYFDVFGKVCPRLKHVIKLRVNRYFCQLQRPNFCSTMLELAIFNGFT